MVVVVVVVVVAAMNALRCDGDGGEIMDLSDMLCEVQKGCMEHVDIIEG